MRPLTDHTPKPLLQAGHCTLIEHHIERLKQAGITELVINTSYLAESIENYLEDGARYGVSISYSRESTALETGGAITHALPLLGDSPFLLVNGDIFTDYPFQKLLSEAPELAHLVLIPNPKFKHTGDFGIESGWLVNCSPADFTYSGIGIYCPSYFKRFTDGESFALGPILRREAEQKRISAEVYRGLWMDIGTPERLQQLRHMLSNHKEH